ncbi:hypothetical protein [Burkholderia gladioli]|uniref:hypothetical protein n=1 Tax=Burkholderia gladioli TaxID=28095 RepID=UPI003D1F9CC9
MHKEYDLKTDVLASDKTHAELVARCKALLEEGKRVEAVKLYRVRTGRDLLDAQRALGIK